MTDAADTTDAAPRASIRAQILAYMISHPGQRSTRQICEHVSASQGSIYAQLSEMVIRGELVRPAVGQYCLPTDPAATDAATVVTPTPPATSKPARAKPSPPAEPAPAPEDATAPIEMAIWHTGELTLRRDDAALVLMADDVRTLMEFLQRVIR